MVPVVRSGSVAHAGAVPTITVGSKVMRGYLESLLEGELDQAGYPRPEEPEKADAADAAETQEAAKADQ